MLGEELTGLSKELWHPGKAMTMQQRGPEQDGELAMIVWRAFKRLGKNTKIPISLYRPPTAIDFFLATATVRFAHQGNSMIEKWSSAAEGWV